MYRGFPNIFQIEKTIKKKLKGNKGEIAEARKEIELSLVQKGYFPRGICTLCTEIYPKAFQLIKEGKYEELEKLKSESPKKVEKELKKIFKGARVSGIVCHSYSRPKLFGKPEKGFILLQEYCTNLSLGPIIRTESNPKKPANSLEEAFSFSLGPMSFHAFGEDYKDQNYFEEQCKQNLRIAEDASITRIDETEIKI